MGEGGGVREGVLGPKRKGFGAGSLETVILIVAFPYRKWIGRQRAALRLRHGTA